MKRIYWEAENSQEFWAWVTRMEWVWYDTGTTIRIYGNPRREQVNRFFDQYPTYQCEDQDLRGGRVVADQAMDFMRGTTYDHGKWDHTKTMEIGWLGEVAVASHLGLEVSQEWWGGHSDKGKDFDCLTNRGRQKVDVKTFRTPKELWLQVWKYQKGIQSDIYILVGYFEPLSYLVLIGWCEDSEIDRTRTKMGRTDKTNIPNEHLNFWKPANELHPMEKLSGLIVGPSAIADR